MQKVFLTPLGPGSKGLPRVFCTTQTLFCTGATPFRTSARGLLLVGSKRPFAPSPNHFRELSLFGQFPRSAASQFLPSFPSFHRENCSSKNVWENVWKFQASFFQTSAAFWLFVLRRTLESLDGQNRQSPIASVQRTRSTLASQSAGPRGTNTTPTNANRAIRIAVQRTQGLQGPNSVFLGGDMTANERY